MKEKLETDGPFPHLTYELGKIDLFRILVKPQKLSISV